VVAHADRGMSALPPWLQIVGAAAAIVCTVLRLWWRWRDTTPRLSVEINEKLGRQKRVDFVIRNKGRVTVPVQSLNLELEYPGHRPQRIMSVPKLTGTRQLHLQLSPRGDAAPFLCRSAR
jgi:hypothetical protein